VDAAPHAAPEAAADAVPLPDEEVRRRDLLRMKARATGLLLVAAAVYVVVRSIESDSSPTWLGFVRAAAEAGMVGGLADWFAVTALFRHPLRLPIPHTAIIPTRKDALGRSLGAFVGTNFLAESVVRDRLRRVDVGRRVGEWLRERAHAHRVTTELASIVRGALGVLRDEDVQDALEQALVQRLAAVQIGPPLGTTLGRIVAEGAHHRLVDLVIDNVHTWLVNNRETVERVVMAQAPAWSPRFLDDRVAHRVYVELLRVAGEVQDDPRHPMRRTLDTYLARLARDLREDPATIARADQIKARLLDRPEVRQAVRDVLAAARRLVVDLVDDPDSELRVRVTDGLMSFGERLVADTDMRTKVNGWIENAAAYVVTNYRDELTRTITDTVERWDAEETSRKIELQVGRDLQFIRINGTVVGALAGVAIHAVGLLL
jgi:uncharacterized membrane-anchored protein YjiN (DUF445 family)